MERHLIVNCIGIRTHRPRRGNGQLDSAKLQASRKLRALQFWPSAAPVLAEEPFPIVPGRTALKSAFQRGETAQLRASRTALRRARLPAESRALQQREAKNRENQQGDPTASRPSGTSSRTHINSALGAGGIRTKAHTSTQAHTHTKERRAEGGS